MVAIKTSGGGGGGGVVRNMTVVLKKLTSGLSSIKINSKSSNILNYISFLLVHNIKTGLSGGYVGVESAPSELLLKIKKMYYLLPDKG